MSQHLECPSPCILRVQNSVYYWPGGACWAAGQCGAQQPAMCGAGLHVRPRGGGVGDEGGAEWGGAGQSAWVVLIGRCGCTRWVELLGAGLAVALIWKLAQMDFLTIWGHQPTLKHAMAARCDSNCRGKLSSDDRTGARWAAGLFGDPIDSVATSSASSVMRLGRRPGERVRASSRFHASSAMRWVGCRTTDLR